MIRPRLIYAYSLVFMNDAAVNICAHVFGAHAQTFLLGIYRDEMVWP